MIRWCWVKERRAGEKGASSATLGELRPDKEAENASAAHACGCLRELPGKLTARAGGPNPDAGGLETHF